MKEFVLYIVFFICSFSLGCARTKTGEPLFLTPYIKNGEIELARQLSEVPSDMMLGLTSYSGFITVKETTNSNLFFWYFPSKNVESVPWVIWLNGGPGSSSLVGLLYEIGPLQFVDGEIKLRNITWASDYSLLFIDSPVGAGFSFTQSEHGYTTSLDQVSAQLYELLQNFLTVFPELRTVPLFVAGESYGGKYVPGLGAWIDSHKDCSRPINMKGIMIGNGLIDPRSSMCYSYLALELGLVDDNQFEELNTIEQSIINLIDGNDMVGASDKFNETIEYIKTVSGVDIYNFLKDSVDIARELTFLTRPDVRKALHVGNISFDQNSQTVYKYMLSDMMNSSKMFVEQLLKNGYGVLSYSGQLDLIVPYANSKHTYNLFEWPGRPEYASAARRQLKHQNAVVGWIKEGGNFTEVLVRGAGHFAPMENPETVKLIVDTFINNFK